MADWQPISTAPKSPSNDNAYGMAEGTIDRYQRFAQEMQQIRKEEWED